MAAIVVGLIMGVLVGVPLAGLGGAIGTVGPPVVALFLAFLMLAITLSKRDVLLAALSPLAGRHGGTRPRTAS